MIAKTAREKEKYIEGIIFLYLKVLKLIKKLVILRRMIKSNQYIIDVNNS